MSHNAIYRFESCVLDVAGRRLLHKGRPVRLTPKEFDLLALLVGGAGRIVTKEEIHQAVWHGASVEDGNLTQTICLLRKVLHEAGVEDAIETLPRHGYRFGPKVGEGRVGAAGRKVAVRAAAVLLLGLWTVLVYWLGGR